MSFSVSTWSLHRALGPMYESPNGATGALTPQTPWGTGTWNLLEVPAEMKRRGITHLEVCHFHFPRTDDAYLADFRAALDAHGIRLFSVLIDAGDVSNPDPERRARDLDWIRGWIEVAARAGAENVRVIAGDAAHDDPSGLDRSVNAFRQLAAFAEAHGVRVMTENFHALSSCPDTLNTLLERLDGKIGLCADFGNYKGPDKYEHLGIILPRADSVHAKADFAEDGTMDRDDFDRCLHLTRAVEFTGPYTLIFEGPGDEWDGVSRIREEIVSVLGE